VLLSTERLTELIDLRGGDFVPAKGKLLHVIGWALIAGGIVLWITGVWYGPGLFAGGLVIETIGYVVARRGELSKPKDPNAPE
jgi:hypothetical protein